MLVRKDHVFTALAAMIGFVGQTACSREATKTSASSVVNMADPAVAGQLISGFYNIEGGRYRWTRKQFAIGFAPPPGSDRNGARLKLTLFVPQQQLDRVGPITLQAEVNGQQLSPQTFTKDGEFNYTRDLPASAATTNILPVRFTLDKAAAPAATDGRELGVVVSRAALEPK